MNENSEKRTPHDVDAARRAEQTLLKRVAQTKRAIRRVDLASAFCAYATLGLALLLLGVLLDHWILAKGFTTRGRLYFAVFWCVATCVFLIAKLIPVVRRRVNALYAAKTLEDSSPNARNLIINWFLLRRDHAAGRKTHAPDECDATQDATLRIVALQASEQSQKIVDETPVDFAPIIRWGIALVVVVAICAFYAVLSPKNLFRSVGRIAAPFAHIERPQAMRVEKTTPGNAVVYQGDFVEIEATIPGSSETSNVEVLYSAEDGRFTELAVPMESIGAAKFKLKFPNNENGLQENLKYCVVVARDTLFESRSETFLLEVRPAPSFQVEKTTLVFPEYTGLPPQVFDRQGDVRALENTRVEIVARSNQPLKRAYFLPDGERPRAISAAIDPNDPTLASVDFQLQWKDPNGDEKSPEFSFYHLVSINENDESNRNVNDYSVSIISDLSPTISWSEDSEEKTEIPVNDVLRVRFDVEDPDYALRRVMLRASFANLEQGGKAENKKDPEPIALKLRGAVPNRDYATGPTPFVGVQKVGYDVVPEKLGLKVGDEVEYWGVAFDSKLPEPNVASSDKRVFVVVEAVENPSIPNENVEQEEQDNAGDGQKPENGQDAGAESGDDGQGQSGKMPDQSEGQNNDSGAQGEQGDSQSEESGDSGVQSDETGGDGSESDGESSSSQTNPSPNEGENTAGQNAHGSDEEGDAEASEGGDFSPSPDSNGEDGGASDERTPGASNSDKSQGNGNDEGETTEDANNPPESGKEGTRGNAQSGTNANNAETSQQDAFEKILDYMEQERSGESSANEGNAPDDEGSQQGRNGSSQEGDASNDSEGSKEAQDEVDPNFNSEANLPTPREKRDLPTRTSPEKPSENAESFLASNPDKLDPNTRRQETDKIDESSNNFLAQNADPNATTSNTSDNRNQNVVMDPQDQSQGTAADAVDPSAGDAKGANVNDVPDAPSEVDQSGASATSSSSQSSEETDRPNAPSNDSNGGENRSNNAETEPGQVGSGNSASQNQDPQGEATPQAPNKGGADQNARSQGGGGGSGSGEIDSGEQTLAPADAPKLQYAEKATNLALEYLENTKNASSRRKLLDELGWTEAQLREFVERWRAMRDDAINDADPAARSEYLKSLDKLRFSGQLELGLGNPHSVDATIEGADEPRNAEGSREASRIKTPKRLEERMRAFTRGVSKTTQRSN